MWYTIGIVKFSKGKKMDNLQWWANNWSWEGAYRVEDDGFKTALKRLQACEDQGISTYSKDSDLPETDFSGNLISAVVEYDGLPDDWDFNTPQEADGDLLGEVYE